MFICSYGDSWIIGFRKTIFFCGYSRMSGGALALPRFSDPVNNHEETLLLITSYGVATVYAYRFIFSG